jgi:hypothetical protein
LEEFDEKLWVVAVEVVTVTTGGKLVFSFKDGTKIEGERKQTVNGAHCLQSV